MPPENERGNSPGNSSAADGEESKKVCRIPEKYLNAFGFINYDHYGKKPWTRLDEKKEDIYLPPEYTAVTNLLGIDCEMVGVGEMSTSALGRVSIVNENGYCIYDTFVYPSEVITDYRTEFSGIRPENLVNAPDEVDVLNRVAEIVNGKTLVGHSIHNDLEVLQLNDHPKSLIRDTALYFKREFKTRVTPSLKDLVNKFIKLKIQGGEHSSILDAQATLKLYLINREKWEANCSMWSQNANLDFDPLSMATLESISEMHVEPRETDLYVDSRTVFLRENKVIGAYVSSEEYLDTQFRLLLEDFLRPLRDGVKTVKQLITNKKQALYHGVRISCKEGGSEVKGWGTLMIPIERNNLRDVDWEEPKILIGGSLLLLTPDNFKSVKFAVVEYRPEDQHSDTNMALYVRFSMDGPSWIVNESNNQFLMMESAAFYEAYKHSLEYLQTVDLNSFPMKKYIVDAVTTPRAPKYLLTTRELDFSVLMDEEQGINEKSKAIPMDVKNWPTARQLNLDESQYEAFQKAITQEMTIIQGPPGTGKTFIGIQIVKLLLTNPWLLDSPILIVSYTNHSLDQTLEQILEFVTSHLCGGNEKQAEQIILRIGGGSKSEIIKPLVLSYKMEKNMERKRIGRQISFQKSVLSSVRHLELPELLIDQGILDFQQLPKAIHNELKTRAGYHWGTWEIIERQVKSNPQEWFGVSVNKNSSVGNNKSLMVSFDRNVIAPFPGISALRDKILNDSGKSKSLLFENSKYIGDAKRYEARWSQYFYLVNHVREIVEEIKQNLDDLEEEYLNLQYFGTRNKSIKSALILGMTTTGAAKHKRIVLKIKPKLMIVEEAAHVLEAHVVASLTQHCQQMIMIGDHKQLRPLTADYKLATDYLLDVSLMERLVKNGTDQGNQNWTQLKVQHRMRPEIARMVCPVIYEELHNHEDVYEYPDVRGASKNIFFVDHRNGEGREKGSRSYYNEYEASYLSGLVQYFVRGQYYEPHQITVIATYLAQKLLLEAKLRNYLDCSQVRISTVDGYQGEENDIILLSLVRNNENNGVGFLKTDNRVCVALSRARHGLFMVGNMASLKEQSETWASINTILEEMQSIGDRLPLTGPGFRLDSMPAKMLPQNFSTVQRRMQSRVFMPTSDKVLRNPISPINPFSSQTMNGPLPKVTANPFTPINLPSAQPLNLPKVTSDPTVYKLPCGHEQKLTIRQMGDLSNVKCITTVKKSLPCGHKQNMHCHMNKGNLCHSRVKKDLPCGHKGFVPCYENAKKKYCTEKKDAVLSCGHEQLIPCYSKPSVKVKCIAPVPKDLPCGHQQLAHCHLAPSAVKCNVPVMQCSHQLVFMPCHQASRIYCHIPTTKTLPCGHEVTQSCSESSVLCTAWVTSKCNRGLVECHAVEKSCTRCTKIFNCGHQCNLFICHGNGTHNHGHYQCKEKCIRVCPRGHVCSEDHDCYQNCSLMKKSGKNGCTAMVATCKHRSETGLIECQNEVSRKARCRIQCKKVFNCGHQCRFECHEDLNPKHLNYQCQEKCERSCPHGKPCPGSHMCYTNCPARSGNKLIPYTCGHGSWTGKCCGPYLNNKCPACSPVKNLILKMQELSFAVRQF